MLSKQEIRQLGSADLTKEIVEAQKNLFRARFTGRTGTSKASHEAPNYKKYVARLLTIQNENKKADIAKAPKVAAEKPAKAEKEEVKTTTAKKTRKTATKKSK